MRWIPFFLFFQAFHKLYIPTSIHSLSWSKKAKILFIIIINPIPYEFNPYSPLHLN